jgi:EAL domain-containing protein (putative c-di-GMP-specific phosphodiesterase class I)
MNFIPLTESSGRIEAMTWQLLGRALANLRSHLNADKDFKLPLNVVPRHLLSKGFSEALRSAVAAARIRRGRSWSR